MSVIHTNFWLQSSKPYFNLTLWNLYKISLLKAINPSAWIESNRRVYRLTEQKNVGKFPWNLPKTFYFFI